MSGARLFAALFLPAELARTLHAAAEEILGRERALRRTRPEELHLTLHFAGEVPRERVPELGPALERAFEGFPATRVALGRTGTFPERGRPRVWWMGIEAAGGALPELARRARAGFSAGLAPARGGEGRGRFAAHVTLARTREGARGPARSVEEAFRALAVEGAFTAGELALVESHLERRAGRYEVLRRFPLRV